jgi:hypothetical protein
MGLAAAAMFAFPASALDWQFSLGAAYRTFGDVDFNGVVFAGPLAQPDDVRGPYINGSNYMQGPIQVVRVVDVNNQIAGTNAVLDKASFAGGSEELDNSGSVILEASGKLWERDSFSLRLNLSVTSLWSDLNTGFSPQVLSDSFSVPGGVAPIQPTNDPPLPAGSENLAGVAATTALADYDIEVYGAVFGAGLSGAFKAGRFAFTLGAGPTLTIAHMDAHMDEVVNWSGTVFNNPNGSVYRKSRTDRTTEVLIGAYAGIGVSCAITESIAAGLEYRYDWIPDQLSGDLADIDLSGHSGILKVTFGF